MMGDSSEAGKVIDFGAPVMAVCGFSGSGKTTLLEAAIPRLIAEGLSSAVVKHDSHGFEVDRRGKDSDRFFRAGATVSLRGPSQQFQRRGASAALTLEATLADLARDHDLVLVEGHKDTQLPKLWVGNKQDSSPPSEVTNVKKVLQWHCDRLGMFVSFIESWLPQAWAARPLYAGLLVGGKSSRMGSPKQLLRFRGRPLGEIAATALALGIPSNTDDEGDDSEIHSRVVLLGGGQVPPSLQKAIRLVDPVGLAGPLAGLIAAHRWNPRATWILSACDHPWLDKSDVQWLVNQRRPGTWAVIPTQWDGHPYPTFGLFEPQSLCVLERALLQRSPDMVRIADLVQHPHTLICSASRRGLFNVNTKLELKEASKIGSSKSSSPFVTKGLQQLASKRKQTLPSLNTPSNTSFTNSQDA